MRDLWSPWGDADMLARAGLMAWRSGYRRDEDIERCVDLATTRGAAAIGVSDHHLRPGGRGDVVLVEATCPAEAAVGVTEASRRGQIRSTGQALKAVSTSPSHSMLARVMGSTTSWR